jgi:PAS domain S-box-containing protein
VDEHATFLRRIREHHLCERLFAALPDVVFCIKDRQRRYRAANQAFADRRGLPSPAAILGRTADDLFPPHLAAAYREQDDHVLLTGKELADRLELVTNRDGSLGWYLATKVPLHDAAGHVIGLASISRDLHAPRDEDLEFAGLAKVVRHIQTHLDSPLRPANLAKLAGLSVTQLDRRMRRTFRLSTAQFIRKSRIGHAALLLRDTPTPVAEIAFACGYAEQSSFTRQFRTAVGMPPAAYREAMRREVP